MFIAYAVVIVLKWVVSFRLGVHGFLFFFLVLPSMKLCWASCFGSLFNDKKIWGGKGCGMEIWQYRGGIFHGQMLLAGP